MKKKNFILFLLSLLFLISILLVVLKKVPQIVNKDVAFGMLHATDAAFNDEINRKNSKINEILLNLNEQKWNFVNPHEYDKVVIELAKSHNLDPPNNWNPLQSLLDPWGNRLEIAYRMLENGSYETIVISNGPDAIYGTEDDLVSGYGRKPPPKMEK